MAVQGYAQVNVIEDAGEVAENDSPAGKPFLRLKFSDGTAVDITTNLAEMIGGVGAGVRTRHGY